MLFTGHFYQILSITIKKTNKQTKNKNKNKKQNKKTHTKSKLSPEDKVMIIYIVIVWIL